jgi:adenylate kinase family enzyme
MIIIEGPDGSGKTTLATQLAEATGFEMVHGSKRPDSGEDLEKQMQETVSRSKRRVIQDRTPWVSNAIYQVVISGEDQLLLWPHHVTGLMFMNSYLFYCRPSEGVILKNMMGLAEKAHKDRHQIAEVQTNAREIIELYDEFMELVTPDCTYNWTASDAQEKFALMVRLAKSGKKGTGKRQLTDFLPFGQEIPNR